MSTADEDWVARLKQGDRDALVAYIEAHRPQLLAFLGRNLSDALRRKVEPDDLLQEVTLSALDALGNIDLGDRDPFQWLCQLGERRIIDAHRRYFGAQKRSATREVGLEASPGNDAGKGLIDLLVASMTTPSQAFSRQQREFHLLQALDTLPADSRDALRLRYIEGLPSKEIAQRLGKTDGATRVLLTRALDKLQKLLGENALFQSLQARQPPPASP